jgi:hypothetical protein
MLTEEAIEKPPCVSEEYPMIVLWINLNVYFEDWFRQ